MRSKVKCPVCFSYETSTFLKYGDFKIYKCGNCSLEFIYPAPSEEDLVEYYKDGYFKGEKNGVRGYKDYVGLEATLEKEAFLRMNFIKGRISPGNLLDIGAGTGVFAQKAKISGFSVYANDISPFAAKALKKRGIKCYLGPVSKKILPVNTFDIVTAWDVVEHVFDINKMLEGIASTLKEGGSFFLTTPDTESWDAKILGKKWYGYKKVPEHILFFNKKSITTLLKNWNFDVIEIKRWGFYRDLNFIVEKLRGYDESFSFGQKLLKALSLGEASWFFPLTDFMVFAQKR